MLNKNSITRFVALGLIIAAIGCGGSGGGVQLQGPPPGGVNFSGHDTNADTPTSSAVVPPAGGTTVTTTSNGTVTVPSGVPDTNITPTDTLAIVPINTGFLGAVPAGSQLIVNGTADSGAFVGTNGLLSQSVGLPVTEAGTNYTLEFPSADLNTNRVLTVHHTIFSGTFYVRFSPLRVISPVPIDIVGRIPNNGQNAAGSVVTALFGPGNNGRSARLFIDYGNGFALDKTVTISNDRAVFANIQHDNSNVPVTGVETVAFIIGDL